jgi:putative nucleotidyltransferase with HDIG domain
MRKMTTEAVPVFAMSVCRTITEAGGRAWLVGGCVRDTMLDRPVKDWDVATTLRPDAVCRIFPKVVKTGIAHGTVTVVGPEMNIEVTTLRVEGKYSDGRRPDSVEFVDDIEKDLARRDFTINAMAYDPLTGMLVDPFYGEAEIIDGRVSAVGEPIDRFKEDGLRPFRAIRLACELQFRIEKETWEAIPLAATTAVLVAKERIREELNRILMSPVPAWGVCLLRDSGLLWFVSPELAGCDGVTQNRHHEFDVLRHMGTTLGLAMHGGDKNLPLALAALLHDVGKPATAVGEGPGRSFKGHDFVGAEMSRDILRRLRYPEETVGRVASLIGNHMFSHRFHTAGSIRRFIRRIGPELVPDQFALRIADMRAHRIGAEPTAEFYEMRRMTMATLERGEPLSFKDLAINGEDVMALGVPEGREVGRILRTLLGAVLEDPSLNKREHLSSMARDLGDGETLILQVPNPDAIPESVGDVAE